MRIYLDMCCYNRPYDDQSQLRVFWESNAKIKIQKLIRDGKIELAASYMLLYECSKNPFFSIRAQILDFIRAFSSSFPNSEQEDTIIEKAHSIMETGIKYKDAYHVAAAISQKCNYFITTDIRLLKYHTDEIIMYNPIEFIEELEDHQNV